MGFPSSNVTLISRWGWTFPKHRPIAVSAVVNLSHPGRFKTHTNWFEKTLDERGGATRLSPSDAAKTHPLLPLIGHCSFSTFISLVRLRLGSRTAYQMQRRGGLLLNTDTDLLGRKGNQTIGIHVIIFITSVSAAIQKSQTWNKMRLRSQKTLTACCETPRSNRRRSNKATPRRTRATLAVTESLLQTKV